MRAPLSIVIPTLNAGDELPATLACLIEGLDAGLVRELIVSDGGSSDDTLSIADGIGAQVVSGKASRGAQLIKGAGGAQGEWLLFLHADTHLDEGWAAAVQNHIKTAPDRAAYFRLGFRASGILARLTAGWANFRSARGMPYGDQALLISRALYEEIGGYADIALMEDVTIARALRGRIVGLEITAFTSAAKYQSQGWFKRGSRNLWTLLRFMLGADPDELAQRYKR